jgi:broad specificity phosphatase PhoE
MQMSSHMNRSTPRIILARHGQTHFNRDRFIMGRMDSPLTEEGVLTARQVGLVVQRQQPDRVYSSPLGRARESAGIYADGTTASIIIRDQMAELACGVWEGRAAAEVKPTGRRLRVTWDDKPPEGESYRDAEVRVSSFIQELREHRDSATILVVGHAGVNRVFLKLWLGLEPESAVKLHLPHDTLFILEQGGVVNAVSCAGETKAGLLFDEG